MRDALPLGELQRWMQAVLVHPAGAEAGVRSDEAAALLPPERVGEVVRGTEALSSVERLGIYHGMYPLRMRDALAADYPMLEALVGEHAFSHLVADYVAAHPSTSYTLNRLGDRLPEYLRTWGPVRGRKLRADLARLELALTEAFDAEPSSVLAPEEVAAVPPERWEEVRLVPVPSLRLLDLTTSASAVFDALRDEAAVAPGTRGRERVVVWRQELAVRRKEQPREAFALLSDLVGGASLGEALDRSAARRGPGPETVTGWFADWVGLGLFRRLERGPIGG